MEMSRSGEELARLEQSLRAAPESRSFAALADAYCDLGRLDDAVALLKRGIALHPQYVAALVLQAQCELKMGRTADAEATFARVSELDPENLVALKYRAERFASRGGVEEAAVLIEQVLEIDPYDAQARQAQARLRQPPQAPAAPAPASASDAAVFDAPGAVSEAPAEPTTPADAEPGSDSDAGTWTDATAAFEAALGAQPPHSQVQPLEPDAAPFRPPLGLDDAAPREDDAFGLGAAKSAHEPAPDAVLDDAAAGPGIPEPGSDAVPFDAGSAEPGRSEAAGSAHVAPEIPESPGTPLADWHVQRADDRIVVRQGPDPGPGQGQLQPPARPTDEFSTLTLARIYESQGYLDKALAIYQDLYEKHPEHPEVLERLRTLQERMAGFEDASEASMHPTDERRPSFEFQAFDEAAPEATTLDARNGSDVEPPHGESQPVKDLGATPPLQNASGAAHPGLSDEPFVAESSDAEAPRRQPADDAWESEHAAPPPWAADSGIPDDALEPSADNEPDASWRMLDIDSLDAQPQQAAEELRGLTDDVRAREQSKRHTLIGQPRRESPPLEEPVEAAATSSEPDFERFLRYVRSIKR